MKNLGVKKVQPAAAPSGAPVEDSKKKEGNKSVKIFLDWLKKFAPVFIVIGFVNWLLFFQFENYSKFFTPWGLVLNVLAIFLGLVVPWWGIELGGWKGWLTAALVIGAVLFILFPLKTFTPLRNWWDRITYSQVIKVPPGGEGQSNRDFSVGDVLFATCLRGHLKQNSLELLAGHQYIIEVNAGFDKMHFFDIGKGGGEVELSFK